jgi:LCP family protein required for cell wall assembly
MRLFTKTKVADSADNNKTPVKFRRREELLKSDSRKNKKRKIKGIIITTVVVAILLVGGFFGLSAYKSIKNIFADDGSGIFSLFNGNGRTQYLKGEANGRINVLLLGVGDKGHDGETLSDTIIMASYDTKTKAVAMFSLPRDLYVQIPGNGYKKINEAHAYGESNKSTDGGPAVARETVQKVVDQTIHYYVRVDFSGLLELVDALGGVTVDVENTFCDYAYPTERKGDTSKVCFDKGKQNMNGTKALQYSRSRHALGVEGSDFARSKRQQRLLVAIKEKAFSSSTLMNPKKLLDIVTTLGDHIKTDASMSDMTRVIELAKGVDTGNIINKNFDNSPEGMLVSSSDTAAGYILKPITGNFKAIQAVIKNIFSQVVMREEKASIALYNGTYNTGLAKRLAESMTKDGYTITTSADSTVKNVTKTIIVDYTDGKKPATIAALEDMFGVKAVKETSSTPTFDIKVTVGKDYKE